jgi:Tol biopolymer transport system component
MSTNGGSEQVLYASDADENDPFLRDGVLFFKSDRTGSWEIYRYDVKGKLLMRLTYNEQPDWNPRVTQDGKKIVVARKVRDRWRLYFANLEISIPSELIAEKIRETSSQKE